MRVELANRTLLVARDMMGDLVNTTGAVATLRAEYPETEFVLEGGAAALELFPEIEVWRRARNAGLPGRLKRASQWRNGRFGACVILDDSHTAAHLARWAGIPQIYGVHRGKPKLFTQSVAFDESGHDLFDSLRNLLTLLGIPDPDVKPRIHPRRIDLEAAEALFVELGEPRVLLHVGASDYRKNWPDSRWFELVHRLEGTKAAAIAGPGEDCGRFGLPHPPGPLSLMEYAALLQKVERLITPDTGAAHLAGAVGTATTVLYGPTDPARFHPWNNDNQNLIRRETACAHYGHGCAFQQDGRCSQACMAAIPTDAVWPQLP